MRRAHVAGPALQLAAPAASSLKTPCDCCPLPGGDGRCTVSLGVCAVLLSCPLVRRPLNHLFWPPPQLFSRLGLWVL